MTQQAQQRPFSTQRGNACATHAQCRCMAKGWLEHNTQSPTLQAFLQPPTWRRHPQYCAEGSLTAHRVARALRAPAASAVNMSTSGTTACAMQRPGRRLESVRYRRSATGRLRSGRTAANPKTWSQAAPPPGSARDSRERWLWLARLTCGAHAGPVRPGRCCLTGAGAAPRTDVRAHWCALPRTRKALV